MPEGISFEGLSCQLCASHLGRDRCILARWPLAAPHCATAYLQRVAYRRTAYYEVTIGHASEPQGMPCISIGLCSPRFPRHAVCRQQAGWDAESWAMHSDDGLLFHSSNRGVEASGATFGPGDVVGCGLQHCLSEPEEIRKIFYTLNGRFLGRIPHRITYNDRSIKVRSAVTNGKLAFKLCEAMPLKSTCL